MQRLTARTTHNVKISPQQIMRYELLRLPSHEIHTYLRELSYENPLLEIREYEQCPRCGAILAADGLSCQGCRRPDAPEPAASTAAVSYDDEERGNWLDSVSRTRTLKETLWIQCLESGLERKDLYIACHLLMDLDKRGFLTTDIKEQAEHLCVTVSDVEHVRQVLMHLEPLGVGATGVRECLLVQATALGDSLEWLALACALISEQWEVLLEGKLPQAARALKVPCVEVERVFRAMLQRFYLYPAHTFPGRDEETVYIHPDVRFQLAGHGARARITVEVLESQRYTIGYARDYYGLLSHASSSDNSTRDKLATWSTEVRRVGSALQQRWQTLQQVCECIAEFQREFFTRAFKPAQLRPLTREEIAAALGIHPSTVGRAVNGKYVELPNRRIVPLSFFFDSRAPIQALIAQLVTDETDLLSDEMLRSQLQRAGWSMTRRAVSLHREGMGILPTHLRRRQRRLFTATPLHQPRHL
jgi:RNA polymerase sigma-54 factor